MHSFAYSDRLVRNPGSWQAKKFIPEILKNDSNQDLTFAKFIQFLVKTPIEKFDTHWMPISRHCLPKLINYDLILKVENLSDDYLKRIFGIEILKNDYDQKKINQNVSQKYFQQLTKTQISKLYEIYQDDFLFFNYTYFPDMK